MICGVFDKSKNGGVTANLIYRMFDVDRSDRAHQQGIDVRVNGPIALGSMGAGVQTGCAAESEGSDGAGTVVAWTGEIFNRSELLEELCIEDDKAEFISNGDIFSRQYLAKGLSCIEKTNGQFAFA